MIIHSSRIQIPRHLVEEDGVATIEARFEGDHVKARHVQCVTPLLKDIRERRNDPNKGFTESREMQKIGSIPMTIWLAHPEFIYDQKAILKYLKSEEGEMFRTVERGI